MSLDDTLAAMKADALAWKKRKADAWGERLAVKPETLSRDSRVAWTLESEAALADEIIASLHINGPLTMSQLFGRMHGSCTRGKLRNMLTRMRQRGQVTSRRVAMKIHEWSAT